MAVDFGQAVYAPNYAIWSRPIIIEPLESQSGMPKYSGRGIYHTGAINVPLEDGTLFSDQQTTLDIIEAEFPVIPVQHDLVTIPADPASMLPALGTFKITDTASNGGGETTLTLEALVIPARAVIVP